uniref:Uncharacterized protein n=1 Tax=Anopheles atroparvus TaxID=41427 RepID=A0AAG5DTZ6_ANOAO
MNNKLWTFAMHLPNENKFQAVLKLALFKKASKHDLDPDDYSAMCKKCATPWQDGFFSVVFMPAKKQYRKQIEKYERMGTLTKQQKSLLKYLKARTRRVAKYTCDICSYKTLVQLDKGKGMKQPVTDIVFLAGAKTSLPVPSGHNAALQMVPPKQTFGSSNGLMKTTNSNNTQLPASKKKNSLLRKNQKFEPKDFRAIQKMLAEKMSS